jgi:sorbitol-specific phosphotransferase system component IIC
MMFAYLVRIALVVLVCVILVAGYRTGHALATVGISSPEAADILMKYYKVSSIAAFCMLVPSIFLFDSLLKRKKPPAVGDPQAKAVHGCPAKR